MKSSFERPVKVVYIVNTIGKYNPAKGYRGNNIILLRKRGLKRRGEEIVPTTVECILCTGYPMGQLIINTLVLRGSLSPYIKIKTPNLRGEKHLVRNATINW